MNDNILKQLIDGGIDNTARIAAIEKFVRELAIQALGESPETASFCKTIDRDFHAKLAEIKNFKP